MTEDQLKEKIKQLTQFPYGKRNIQYQSYYVGNEYIEGSRDIKYRFDKFLVDDCLSGNSVLDLGCNLGTTTQLCFKRGARDITGIDYEKDYIECAQELAKFNNHPIKFHNIDLKEPGRFEDWYKNNYPKGVDMLFTLAIDKHIGLDRVLSIIDHVTFKSLFFEGSAAKNETTPHVVKTTENLKRRFGNKVRCLGYTEDRNKRFIWRVDL